MDVFTMAVMLNHLGEMPLVTVEASPDSARS
jgi:hypothetical protein